MRYHQGVRRIKAGDAAAVIIYIAMGIASVMLLPGKGNVLRVSTENGEYAYSLDNDGVYSFQGPIGITEIEIKDGKAHVISSPCRGKDCIRQGYSSSLCCLPNKIIATTASVEEFDAEAG